MATEPEIRDKKEKQFEDNVNRRIAEQLKKRKENLAAMERATGINRATLSKIKAGHRPPRVGQIGLIAEHLGISMDYLFFGKTQTLTAEELDVLQTCYRLKRAFTYSKMSEILVSAAIDLIDPSKPLDDEEEIV